MSFQLQQEDIKEVMTQLAKIFNQEKNYLNDLDSKIGDGDHGLSMSRGFHAIANYLDNHPNLSISDILVKGGMQFNEVTGSTIGFLIFAAMRAAGLTVQNKPAIDFNDLQNILTAAIEAIKKRGKASRGQKTILDSLIPTLEYLDSQKDKKDESEMIKEAIKVAIKTRKQQKTWS